MQHLTITTSRVWCFVIDVGEHFCQKVLLSIKEAANQVNKTSIKVQV